MPDEPNDETPQAPQEPAPEPEAPTPPEGDDPWSDPDKAKREIEKLRRENAAQRTKAKDRDQLAKKVAEFEQAQLTEQERTANELAAAQKRAAQLQERTVRAEIKAYAADQFADPEDAAAFLQLTDYVDGDGDVDSERIKADLADLLKRKPHLGKAEPFRRPAPDPHQGSSANGRPPSDPRAEFGAFMARALKQGR